MTDFIGYQDVQWKIAHFQQNVWRSDAKHGLV